jgi:hypothetical protein
MKRCSRCGIEKPHDQFHRNSLREDGLQSYCKLCKKGIDAEIYARGGEEYKRHKRLRQRAISNRNARLVFGYLQQHPCVDCGDADPTVLEFDHVRGEKKHNIADLIRRYGSWDTIRAEIEKCEVRCANCHRRATAKRHGMQRYLLGLELLT